MESLSICFLMYPWENISPTEDSTLRLVHEVSTRGYKVAITTPSNLTIRNSITSAFCRVLNPDSKLSSNTETFYKKATFKDRMLPLAGFDLICIRDNPPLNPITLNFLDSVKHDTIIVNDIDGLRKANNKLYTAAFYDPEDNFIPVTHVSKSKDYLKRVIQESETDRFILKPLDGYGGSGVIILEKNAMHNINSLLDYYITSKGGSNYVIVQEYVKGAEMGDVRILMLNGEAIGAMKRIPAADDHRSNTHAGGQVAKHTLSKQEKLLCKKVGPKLVSDGLYFVGLDVIAGKLIEINVISPGGITRINRLNKVRLQAKVVDFFEEKVRAKEFSLSRKSQLKQAISDL